MNLSVECPRCGKSYQVAEERVGSQARCSNCSHTFTLTMALDETAAPKTDSKSQEQPASGGSQTAPPKKIGHYVVRKKLGAGAMGEVYLAYDPNLDRQVAIKMLPPGLAQDQGRWKRFLREARSAAKLHHGNVATVYLAGKAEDRAFIAMELVDGGSLDEALARDGPMDWREATGAIRDAAAGLAAAHKIGLVHRDIKPANLMRTAEGVTKVVDFGLARARVEDTQLTRNGAILGTPAYMSPEQWKGEELDGRSDLYSLICTYYALLTGVPPFDAAALGALGYLHCHELLPDPRELAGKLPDAVCRILLRGSAKDAGQRYQTAEELVADLDALLASPDESLTFACSWEALIAASAVKSEPVGPASAASVPSDRLPVDIITPVSRTARRKAGRAGRASAAAKSSGDTAGRLLTRACDWLRTPVGLTAAAAAGIAAVLLGIVMYVSTNYGTVKIELSDPAPNVEVKVDGDTVEIAGLERSLKLKAGEHDLLVTSADFETHSRSFSVKRGQEELLRVSLVPRPKKVPLREAASIDTPQTPLQRAPDVSKLDEEITIDLGSGVTMELVLIPAGSFMMGSPDSDPDAKDDEKPRHQVTITKPFYLGKHEVTEQQWHAVMGGNPSVLTEPKRPVSSVSWDECQGFIAKLNERLGKNGARFSLPTEAQWEYACRAVSTTRCYFGDDPGEFEEYAWGSSNSGSTAHPVGQKKPNAWGLFDMHGNVWEWCADWYGPNYYERSPENDPTGPQSGLPRVLRGGSWCDGTFRSASRNPYPPGDGGISLGFRVARSCGSLTAKPDTQTASAQIASAVYQVTVHPPEATVAVSGKGATITGSGATRTITVTEPDGQAEVLLLATMEGYLPIEQAIRATPEDTRTIALRLQPANSLPATSPTELPTYPGSGENLPGPRLISTLPETPDPAAVVSIGPRNYRVSEIQLNDRPDHEHKYYPSLSVLSNGRLLATWQSGAPTDCFGRRFSETGFPIGPKTLLNRYNTSGWEYGPTTAPLPDGGFVVAWGDSSASVHLQRFDAEMRPVGRDSLVGAWSPDESPWPAVASAGNGDFVVVGGQYNFPYTVYARRFHSSGAPYGDMWKVNTEPLGYSGHTCTEAAAALASDGSLVIAWNNARKDVRARRYDSQGRAIGDEFIVCEAAAAERFSLSLAYNSSDELIIAWHGPGRSGKSCVFVQRYSIGGSPIEKPRIVNTETGGSCDIPCVAVGPSDEFLVSFRDQDDDSQGISARLYASDGKPIGNQFRVNRHTLGAQSNTLKGGRRGAAICGDTLAFTWRGDGPGGSKGAFLTTFVRVD